MSGDLILLLVVIALIWFASRPTSDSSTGSGCAAWNAAEGYKTQPANAKRRTNNKREPFASGAPLESGAAFETDVPGAVPSSMTGVASSTLPKPDVKPSWDWSAFAPSDGLKGETMLLEPHRCIGQDTVSNHLRNASYDLRSEPPNPTVAVSPWINTTIGPDLTRRPLEQ
jgi:hypothetical protein